MSRFIKYIISGLLVISFICITVLFVSKKEQRLQRDTVDSLEVVTTTGNIAAGKVFSYMDSLFMNVNSLSKYNTRLKALLKDSLSDDTVLLINNMFSKSDSIVVVNDGIILNLKHNMHVLGTTSFDTSSLQDLIIRMETYNHQIGSELNYFKELMVKLPVKSSSKLIVAESMPYSDSLIINRYSINKAYYKISSNVDLLRKGIIKRKYLIFGKAHVNENASLSLFDTFDMKSGRRLYIDRRRVELITPHPEGSYKFIYNKRGTICKELVIIDPENFWRETKILVISCGK